MRSTWTCYHDSTTLFLWVWHFDQLDFHFVRSLDLRKGEFRLRAQRFLTGEFNVDDLNRLFLFLRQNSYGNQTVRDIGHMIGHADSRESGISLRRVNDFYDITQFQAQKVDQYPDWTLDICDAPPSLIRAMEATFRLLDDDIIMRDTGLRRDQAGTALTKLKRRFQPKDNGRLMWTGAPPLEKHFALLKCLTSYIISRPAYDGDALFTETLALLVRHGFMETHQEPLLLARKPHLLLYAIAAMHGVSYQINEDATVEAEAGWASDTGEALLVVTANIEVDHKRNISWGFPIFSTDLLARDWVADYSSNFRHGQWTVPIELTNEPKLRTID